MSIQKPSSYQRSLGMVAQACMLFLPFLHHHVDTDTAFEELRRRLDHESHMGPRRGRCFTDSIFLLGLLHHCPDPSHRKRFREVSV